MGIQVLLNDRINQFLEENKVLKESDKNNFEVVVAGFLNIKYLNGLDSEDLLDGIIGGGGDEGIDMCYLFHNDEIVKEIEDSDIRKSSKIDLELIQSKESIGFSTDGFRKLCEGVEEMFNLEDTELKKIGANEELISKVKLIQEVFRRTKLIGAEFRLRVHYVTKGNTSKIDTKINHLKNNIQDKLNFVDTNIKFNFFGAQELYNLCNYDEEQLSLSFEDTPLDLREEEASIKGYAGFIRGNSLMDSLIDKDENRFRDELTEGNIRYFLGEAIVVNKSIIETALSENAQNFWAMNNGITIIGDRIEPEMKNRIIIDNPQIVNGCQTVHCLYEAYSKSDSKLSPKLKVFVKLVETKNYETQQDIITATNSQTSVLADSLKANEIIQRNIEDYLKLHKIYYERRKNFYKRKGKTGLDVFSIRKVAQIMHTIFRKEAIIAVNHTKNLFENPDLYKKIFNINADYDAYRFACKLYQKIWRLKNSDLRTNKYDSETKELRSKSLFCLLHISSSILFKTTDTINIAEPKRKNKFSLIKEELFRILNDDKEIQEIYNTSAELFMKCTNSFGTNTGKVKNTLFKNRSFDKDYIISAVSEHIKVNE